MQAFTKPAAEVMRRPQTIAMPVLWAISANLRAVANVISIWTIERRRGRAAERMHEQLRCMSGADLAKFGIKRDQITQYIKERLY